MARNPSLIPGKVEYRSAGAYVAELYYAQLGDDDARHRLDMFHRVAAHQTTADNPGLLPESIVQPVINYIEVARPLVNTVGPVDLGSGSWSYARVTQHTQVGKQAGEKTELASRKMTITKTPLGADTFGGYVNVSKQDINRSSPAILDMIINDLAEQYAIETEEEMAAVMTAAATAGPVIPASPTGANVATAIWGAAGSVFAATKGQGRTVVAVCPDQLGAIGPLFPTVNPTNAYSHGLPRRLHRPGRPGHHLGPHGHHVGRSRHRHDPRLQHRGGEGVRVQVRRPAGRRAVRVGCAGRLRRRLRLPSSIEPTGVVRVTTA